MANQVDALISSANNPSIAEHKRVQLRELAEINGTLRSQLTQARQQTHPSLYQSDLGILADDAGALRSVREIPTSARPSSLLPPKINEAPNLFQSKSQHNAPSYYSFSPPMGYVAGLGRGAVGFTTRSDIGPSRDASRRGALSPARSDPFSSSLPSSSICVPKGEAQTSDSSQNILLSTCSPYAVHEFSSIPRAKPVVLESKVLKPSAPSMKLHSYSLEYGLAGCGLIENEVRSRSNVDKTYEEFLSSIGAEISPNNNYKPQPRQLSTQRPPRNMPQQSSFDSTKNFVAGGASYGKKSEVERDATKAAPTNPISATTQKFTMADLDELAEYESSEDEESMSKRPRQVEVHMCYCAIALVPEEISEMACESEAPILFNPVRSEFEVKLCRDSWNSKTIFNSNSPKDNAAHAWSLLIVRDLLQ